MKYNGICKFRRKEIVVATENIGKIPKGTKFINEGLGWRDDVDGHVYSLRFFPTGELVYKWDIGEDAGSCYVPESMLMGLNYEIF